MFRVGQKVVCIGPLGKWFGGHGDEITPINRAVYTVRAVEWIDEEEQLQLEEIVNRPRSYMIGFRECAFRARFFRPAVSRKTDISIFTDILRKVEKKKPAPVEPFPSTSWHGG